MDIAVIPFGFYCQCGRMMEYLDRIGPPHFETRAICPHCRLAVKVMMPKVAAEDIPYPQIKGRARAV